MPPVTASLCDVNVLLALLHERHAHSARAARWLDSVREAGSVLVCRVAHLGTLRLLTSPRIMREDAVEPAAAWAAWETLLSDERFAFAAEPAGMEVTWRDLCSRLRPGATVGTDVYLAAFALAADCRLVTFDTEFRRFQNLACRILR